MQGIPNMVPMVKEIEETKGGKEGEKEEHTKEGSGVIASTM